jgi:hypothetical protein
MFWASFLGLEKGPSLFWEKEWGWIQGAFLHQLAESLVPCGGIQGLPRSHQSRLFDTNSLNASLGHELTLTGLVMIGVE